jgi:glucose-6-phosphate dehydrogenase assembly protein OpcA
MISENAIEPQELGLEVPVAAIEHELRLLWQNDEARTQASLINLLVYSERPGSLLENSRMIRELTREHACRAILVEINRRQDEPGLRAWITAHCHLAQGRKSVCCEQIAFHLTGRVAGRFRNTVFAHLQADLPVVFWWQGELSEVLTDRLATVIDRLIVDSSTWADPAAGFARLEVLAAGRPDWVVHDHEWTRSWQFRLGIASLFDSAAAQQAMEVVDAVSIRHHPAHRVAAIQMLAWLAVQGGWRDAGPVNGLRNPCGRPIRLELAEDPEVPALGMVEIRAGESRARVSLRPGEDRILREWESPAWQSRSTSPADPQSALDLCAMQLARGGRNTLFHKILPRLRSWLA